MFDGREPLLDVELFTPVFEWVIPELLSDVGYDFSWQHESAHDVVPYEIFNLVSHYRCNWFCLDPHVEDKGRIVRIKIILMLFGITTVLIDVNAAQSKLVLLENFNENYSKCLRLLYKVNAAEGVNAASEEVSTAYVI
ncbi:hypothetical protein Tco_1189497, partial [Tanacetum coccineum]